MKTHRSKSVLLTHGCLLLAAASFAAVGCGDDDDSPNGGTGAKAGKGGVSGKGGGAGKAGGSGKGGTSAKGGGSGKGGTAAKGGTGGTGGTTGGTGGTTGGTGGSSGAGDAGMSGESGQSGASGAPGNAVQFTIPAGGGDVEMQLPNGDSVGFEFPASAAGQEITLTPDTAESIGWGNRFQDVIRMEPDGLTFDDPVVIKPSNKDLLLFDFPSSSAKSAPEGLALNAAGDGLLLNHFSTLVVVPAGVSCDSTSGWNVTADANECSEFGSASNLIEFGCKAYTYCLFIDAKCCAVPGETECKLGMEALTLTFTPNDGNGDHPYCVQGGQGGTGGSGGNGGLAGGAGTGGGGTGGLGGAASGGIGGLGGAGAGGTTGGTGGAPPLVSCFAPGTEASPTGTGTCASSGEYRVDMSLAAPGTVMSHTSTSGTSSWTGTSTCASGAARHDVYILSPFIGWETLQVSAQSSDGAEDVKISILYSDAGCAGNEVVCGDTEGAGSCDFAEASWAELASNYITVVVSSTSTSTPIETSFRLY